MGSAQVITKEIDLSTRVPSFPGVYAGIVIPALKGPINSRTLITNESQLLSTYTPDGTITVGMSVAFFSALAYLNQGNKLWVSRAQNVGLFGGAVAKAAGSSYNPYALPVGMSDPTAFVFDALPDAAAVKEVTQLTFSQAGAFYDVSGAAKAIQLYDSPAVGHYFWATVTGGANTQIDPTLSGTGHQVAVLPGDTAAQVATKFNTVIAAVVAAFVSTNPSAGVVNVTNQTAGACTHASATGTAAAVLVSTSGLNAVSTVDDSILFYQADPGAYGNELAIQITNYDTSPAAAKKVKEPGAFMVEVFKTSNLVVPIEQIICSRQPGAKNGFGANIFVEDAMLASNFVRAISNPAVDPSVEPKDTLAPLVFNGGSDGSAVTDADMVNAAQFLANKEETPLTVLMDGGWNTPVYQQALDTICQVRKDCVAVFGVPYSAEVTSTYLNDIETYKNTTLNLNSSYSALYTPHVKIFDKYNNRQIFVSPDGYAAAAISLSASNFEIWYPPAGFKRGSVTVLDLRKRFTRGEMDSLYDAGINPLRFAPGKGIFIWGQKTLSARPSALDRLNVRLLLITIEPAIATALEDFLFELNDSATRSIAQALVTSYMEGIKARRGVTDFSVVCNDSNNSPNDIDNGIMNMWVFVKPTRSLETIPFSVIITSTGISFSLAAQLVG